MLLVATNGQELRSLTVESIWNEAQRYCLKTMDSRMSIQVLVAMALTRSCAASLWSQPESKTKGMPQRQLDSWMNIGSGTSVHC